jgi:hypothetical protein
MELSKTAILSAALGFLCIASGCQRSLTPAQAQILKVVELGSKLNSATEAGLSYSEFRSSVLEYVGALDLAIEMWPHDLSPSVKQGLLDSKQVWLFTKDLWAEKIDSSRYPDLTIRGMPQQLAEEKISKLPEKAMKTLFLSNGDYLGRKKEDGGKEIDAKHLSFGRIGDALTLAGGDFVSARKEIASYLR